ncbi:MAG: 2-dehydropantoate 2-reductase [Clostridia bacterium]|nr:2-dehydropantoate 2-reductase [Clostridia bacterium]
MTAQEAKIAVYGAGAMGTVLGAFLTAGGLNVELVTRNEAHVAAMQKAGAKLVCRANGIEYTVKVNALIPSEMAVEYDVIFLMTKQKNNGEILDFLLPKLKGDGVICTTQNGLPEEAIANRIGVNRTYGGVVTFGANLLNGGGMVELTSKMEAMRIQVGGYKNDGAKTELLTDILSYAGKVCNEAFVSRTDNLAGARWSKLCINAAFSGLSVVTGLSFGQIARKKKSKKIALGILRECMDVASANGVVLERMSGYDMQKWLGSRGLFGTMLAKCLLPIAMRKHKRLVSGMLKDVESGKKCEIDFINGAVSAAGKRVGVATPLCDTVVEIVHGIENGLYEITEQNLDFFKNIKRGI